MKVLGFDLSLTRTGVALMDEGIITRWDEYKTSPDKEQESYRDTLCRVGSIVDGIEIDWLGWEGYYDLAVIEGPSFGSRNGKPHERAHLWWETFKSLANHGIPVATVAPATRAKFITGNGRADKKAVLEAVRNKVCPECPNHDVADAMVLAYMGSARVGEFYLGSLSKDERNCLSKMYVPVGLS